MTERKHRIEDALEAVRSAQEGGIVPGGGAALRASRRLLSPQITVNKLLASIIGTFVKRPSIKCPLTQDTLRHYCSDILDSNNSIGWNFRTNEISNMFESGIIDPVKVTKTALTNAMRCGHFNYHKLWHYTNGDRPMK